MTTGLSPRARALLGSPALASLLTEAGLGCPGEDATELAGRNTNIAVTTTGGRQLFVKQYSESSRSGPDESPGILAFEQFAAENRSSMDLAGIPVLLARDDDARIAVYPLVPDAEDLAHTYDDQSSDPATFSTIGTNLARLHCSDQRLDLVPTRPHRFPPLEALDGLTVDQWSGCSAGELEAWSLMQHDPSLCRALAEVRELSDSKATSPIHGDLRLDQILVAGDRIHLTDFEEFCLADPARDIGALLGDVAYRAVLSIIKDWSGEFALEVDLDHDTIIERGSRALDGRSPEFAAFWSGYRSVAGDDPELATRSTRWIGWHMFDRLLAAGHDRNRLLSVHRAAAGIGRAALTRPEHFRPIFEGAA